MILRLLSACFLLCALWSQPLHAADNPDARILFINSYHRGYSWSDSIEEGLQKRLNASGKKIELSIEYLDSRRFAYGAQIEPLAQAMAVKYANYRPNLVVVSDNTAFDFAVSHRERLFPGLPIIFCGYNNFQPDVIKGIANITGVNEEVAIEDTVAMALRVHPQTRTLAFVASTGEASSKRISEVAEKTVFPKLRERFEVVVMKDASVEQIRQRLASLPKETLLFLSGQATDQGAGRAMTPAENGSLITAVSPFPAYTFWDFHLGQGVIGGHIITGSEQGRTAADMALRVLAGMPADSIPVIMTTPTHDIFDYRVMERFGVKPEDLPIGAQIINRPFFSVWDRYRWQIISVISLLGVETALIVLLLHIARGRRKALAALDEERTLLEQRVVERTHELQVANEQLANLSITDGLTGLANRRHFDEVLDNEYVRLRRSGAPLSLVLLDVDYFKLFNDTYGHPCGDDCLRQVAALIAGLVNRASDLAARYGGEEFALILPETDAQGAVALAERLRSGIEQLAIPHSASKASHVTASLGVITVAPTTLPLARDAIKLADTQLYQAKAGGRNRVVARDIRQT
jgi:diguanylate cyclase (GGDEF)-like protein